VISYIDLTPFIPLSLQGEGEEILERGAQAPLFYLRPLPFPREGGKGDRLESNIYECWKSKEI
jgi:hypothetical protein